MTTILASLKHRVMVADSYVTGGVGARSRKIFEVDGKLVGVAGHMMHALKFVEWLRHGTPINPVYDKEDATFDAIVMEAGFLTYYDNELTPLVLQDQIYAIGSGADFALGAIDAGATPKRAVEIAAERDDSSKPPVIVVKLK